MLAGIRAGGVNLHRLPKCLAKTFSGLDESGALRRVHLPLRGQRRLGLLLASVTLLLPVELRHLNHAASTNAAHSSCATLPKLTRQTLQCAPMSEPSPIDQITERVERLLLRYQELLRTNSLLTQQIESLTHERDSLKSRLGAARARVDALLERLPADPGNGSVKPAFKTAVDQDAK